jgi:hypothetical protein
MRLNESWQEKGGPEEPAYAKGDSTTKPLGQIQPTPKEGIIGDQPMPERKLVFVKHLVQRDGKKGRWQCTVCGRILFHTINPAIEWSGSMALYQCGQYAIWILPEGSSALTCQKGELN